VDLRLHLPPQLYVHPHPQVQLSIDINAEVKDQNSMLDGMGTTLGSTTEMLTSTIGRIGTMISSGGSSHMFAMVGFIVAFFLLLYFLMGSK